MKDLRGGINQTNASIISILQRIFDVSVIFLGVLFSALITNYQVTLQHWVVALISLAAFQMIGGITDFYRSWRGMPFSLEMKIIIKNWTLSIIITFGLLYFFSSIISFEKIYYLYWFAITTVGFFCARAFIRIVVHYLRLAGYNNRKVVILGDSKTGLELVTSIKKAPWLGLKILGYFLPENTQSKFSSIDIDFLGSTSDLINSAKRGEIDRIYVALTTKDYFVVELLLKELADTTCTVMLVPDIFTFNILQSKSEVIQGVPIISLYDTSMSGLNQLMKRVEDIILSLLIVIFISPVMLLIAISVKLTSTGPVIFKQKRYGIDGKAISVWKFRSMCVMENDNNITQAKRGDTRITKIGAILRKTSLDELPQFFNVIKGDMSIVGPRPHAVAHNEQYRKIIKGYMLRHKMKPGITGWAQINGWRGETETLDKMEKRVEFDLYYIQHWSLWFDLKIVFLTIFKGFINKSAY
jgi:putative colanic acid biosynthesis UDP-glucose lipid carrier transferase